MGVIAEGFMAFAKPLLDQSDGTQEGMQKALSLGQFCHNLALLPEDDRIEMLAEAQEAFGLDDAEFDEFRKGIVAPMLERHRQMFPLMHQRVSPGYSFGDGPSGPMLWDDRATTAAPAKTKPKVDRYAPCPCGSGKKYKFCCGAKGR